MISKRFILAVTLGVTALAVCSSDEVILNEGKTLTGRITDEDENELTINLGANMVLHVDKSKVKEIHRDAKPQTKRPIITLEDMKKKAASSPIPMPTPMAPPTPIKNAEEGAQTQQRKIDNTLLIETLVTQSIPIERPAGAPSHPSTVHVNIRWEGRFGKEGSLVKWDSMTIISTTTVSVPYWRGPKNPDPAEVKTWNAYFDGVQNHNKGHMEIYSEALSTIISGFNSLRADSEAALNTKSRALVKEILARAEKQQRGYDRREKSKKR